MAEVSFSTFNYLREQICTHSAVDCVTPADVRDWTVIRVKREGKLRDITVVIMDGYEFSEAQADSLPHGVDFVLLSNPAGPGCDEEIRKYLAERSIGIGKIGVLKKALNKERVYE